MRAWDCGGRRGVRVKRERGKGKWGRGQERGREMGEETGANRVQILTSRHVVCGAVFIYSLSFLSCLFFHPSCFLSWSWSNMAFCTVCPHTPDKGAPAFHLTPWKPLPIQEPVKWPWPAILTLLLLMMRLTLFLISLCPEKIHGEQGRGREQA